MLKPPSARRGMRGGPQRGPWGGSARAPSLSRCSVGGCPSWRRQGRAMLRRSSRPGLRGAMLLGQDGDPQREPQVQEDVSLSSLPSGSPFLVPSNSDKRIRNPAWLEVDEQLHGKKQGRGQRAPRGGRTEHPPGTSPRSVPAERGGARPQRSL